MTRRLRSHDKQRIPPHEVGGRRRRDGLGEEAEERGDKEEGGKKGPKIDFCSHGNQQKETEGDESTEREKKTEDK